MSLFYHKKTTPRGYLFSPVDLIDLTDIRKFKTIHCPLDIDTEFTSKNLFEDGLERTIITNQVKAISEKEGRIYTHPHARKIARHKVFEHFSPVEYLQDMGIDCSISRVPIQKQSDLSKLRKINFCLYSFFANAEVCAVVTGEYLSDIIHYLKKGIIDQQRRLTAKTPSQDGQTIDRVFLPWVMNIAGDTRQVSLTYFDTCAVHGVASYADFCAASDVELLFKDTVSKDEKGRMMELYIEDPQKFDNYSLGDLYNYQALENNAENFRKIYEILGLSDYYSPPKLTIGSTVKDIFKSKIGQVFGVTDEIDELVAKICKPANANHLKNETHSTRCLNAKVRGGRCRNNRPLDTVFEGVLCDIDISGCYGEGQRNQLYPFGIPLIIDYPWNEQNKYISLKRFLSKYRDELVPGCWQAIASTKSKLKYRQDFLPSWILPPKIEMIAKIHTDTDYQDNDLAKLDDWLNKSCGEVKIFNHEIINGLLSHDFLDWLDNICSPQQRKELMENLMISTAIIYPKSERVDSPEQLLENIEIFEGENECKATIKKGKSKTTKILKKCHSWYGINMGDMLITKLLVERKKHPKKTPLNTLLKLCINTLYGDMVSPFFKESNVVVGNNITARARALAWYMEKGFNGWQSITDGCVFDMNSVVFNGRRNLSGTNTVNIHRYYDRNLDYKPLEGKEISIEGWEEIKGGKYPILKSGDTIIPANESHRWIDEKAWIHLQNCFPNVAVLHSESTDVYGNIRKGQFVFETKAIYERGCFHGTANYYLINPDKPALKMRSYEKKEHQKFENNCLEKTDPPSEVFLKQLIENPDFICRGIPFVKPAILKPRDFKNRFDSYYGATNLVPGDTLYKPGMLREFSLSQFTFLDYDQYKNWSREYNRLKNKYSQSYEMFFTDNGILKYQTMIELADKAISEGYDSFLKMMDKNRHKTRNDVDHPHGLTYQLLKDKIDFFYRSNADITDNDWADTEYPIIDSSEYIDAQMIEDCDELLDDVDF